MKRSRLLLLLVVAGCTTGETSEDQRTRAIRDMVRRGGYTEDVAACIVDELEATVGLAVLEDESASDELTAQINDIATGCLLVVPTGTGGPSSSVTDTVLPGTSTAPQDPDAVTTTTGSVRSQ